MSEEEVKTIEPELKTVYDFVTHEQKYGKRVEDVITSYINKQDLAQQIYKIQPYFYDKNSIWWFWNDSLKKWEIVDDTQILVMVSEKSNANTISSKDRTEIIESMKQFGRKKIPEAIKKNWVQFVDRIYDLSDGSFMDATPKYFVTNPIPWEVSGNPETPTIDKIFEEWVGEEYKQLLHEIVAYCLLPDYPINRLFCFIGSGMNGKSCFLNLLKKFVGDDNICSTELDTLLSSRFEVTRLHKKLVCFMGETNFDEISKTSMLKKLTGGDIIGFEYKNKTPFEDYNYAKILIATNNLPSTTDKTLGFYRRWCIIDFPNKFSEKKDILKDIPEEEYKNLATNCIITLNKLLKEREFTNEGTIEERAEKYESKSNFLDKFLKLFVIDDFEGYITKSDFSKKFNSWCKENKHREMSDTTIGLEMKKKGFESSTKHFNWMNDGKGGTARVWLSMKWKE
jgi:P4 family phage/plasmid primase-like protien